MEKVITGKSAVCWQWDGRNLWSGNLEKSGNFIRENQWLPCEIYQIKTIHVDRWIEKFIYGWNFINLQNYVTFFLWRLFCFFIFNLKDHKNHKWCQAVEKGQICSSRFIQGWVHSSMGLDSFEKGPEHWMQGWSFWFQRCTTVIPSKWFASNWANFNLTWLISS